MNDYDAIKETIFHYFEGVKNKDRARLERAFALDVANIIGYDDRNADGGRVLWCRSMRETIDKWVSDEIETAWLTYGKILSIHIFSDVAATATFDCAGRYIDTFQLVKLDGEWRIANKFFTNQ
jgi:hypothetical protein